VHGQLRSDPGPFSEEWTALDAGGAMAETVAHARAALSAGKMNLESPIE
jgi:hypothetical protein